MSDNNRRDFQYHSERGPLPLSIGTRDIRTGLPETTRSRHHPEFSRPTIPFPTISNIMSTDSQHSPSTPDTATSPNDEVESDNGFAGPLGVFIDGFRSTLAGLRGRRCRISKTLELTETTSLRGSDQGISIELLRVTVGMALFAMVIIAVCVAVFWLLWPLVSPNDVDWMQRNSFAIAGCAVGFSIILACFESLLIATCGAVLLVGVAHVALLLAAVPALREFMTHSGEAKHVIFFVVGLGIGVGLGFATLRTSPPTDEAPNRAAPRWRLVSIMMAASIVAGTGLGLYWLSQQLSDKETHNAKLIGALTAALSSVALLLSRKNKNLRVAKKFVLPTVVLTGLGGIAGWVIEHPRLNEIKIVNGFGDGLILGATLTLSWVWLQWFVRPHYPKHRTAAWVVMILLMIVASILLAFAFNDLNRESRWYSLLGFGIGTLFGSSIAHAARSTPSTIRRRRADRA